MHRLIAALLLLAACAAPPAPQAALRDTARPMFSAALFEPARLSGAFVQVADIAAPGAPACAPGRVEFGPGGQVAGRLCLNGREVPVQGRALPVGPGRLAIGASEPWWIVWVDEGYRTLAVGTPSGAFGFVLDRAGGGEDRLRAAAEILDFNGYDPARLRRLRAM